MELKGKELPGFVVQVDANPKPCRFCDEEKNVHWAVTKSGSRAPMVLREGGWVSHFADCPGADKARRKA
jgi:hypothetical protein